MSPLQKWNHRVTVWRRGCAVKATNFRQGEQKRRADKLPLEQAGRAKARHRVDAPCQLLPRGPGRARPCFRATGRAPRKVLQLEGASGFTNCNTGGKG